MTNTGSASVRNGRGRPPTRAASPWQQEAGNAGLRSPACQRHRRPGIDVKCPKRGDQRQKPQAGHEKTVHETEQQAESQTQDRKQHAREPGLHEQHGENDRERDHAADRDVDARAPAYDHERLPKRDKRQNGRELQHGRHGRQG